MSSFENDCRFIESFIGFHYHRTMFILLNGILNMFHNEHIWFVRKLYHAVRMTGCVYMMALLSDFDDPKPIEEAFELYKQSLDLWKKTVEQ